MCLNGRRLDNMNKRSVFRIIIFYIIAISISNIFRFNLFGWEQVVQKLPLWGQSLLAPLQSAGIFIGALIALYLLKRDRDPVYSFFGTSLGWSLVMALIPLLLLTVIGVKKSVEINIHLNGLIIGLGTLTYCYFEEIGWRGYLQDELHNLNEFQRVLIIGFLWYFWHLMFINDQSIINNLIFGGILTISSWGLGKVIELTKSILAVASFHMVINIIAMNSIITNSLSGSEKLLILAVAVILYIVILIQWSKNTKTKFEE